MNVSKQINIGLLELHMLYIEQKRKVIVLY